MVRQPYSPAHERLRTLGVLHYIAAGLMLALMQVPLFLLGLAAMELLQPSPLGLTDGKLPPLVGEIFFLILGAALLLYVVLLAIALAISGYCLKQHQHYWFSAAVACGALLFIPLGTLLGAATLVVLLQDSVRSLYGIPLGTPQ